MRNIGYEKYLIEKKIFFLISLSSFYSISSVLNFLVQFFFPIIPRKKKSITHMN